ncbi:MAG: carboxypeptidase-like regulatory domain-containing protein [Candidatus Baltobacteraceae bacterium]
MRKPSSLQRMLALLGLLTVFIGQATVAQAGTLGGIAGFVTDSKTGAPIAGVRVQISSPSQSITTTTDARGHFIAFSLQPDDYTLTAQKDGYGIQAFKGYSVFADQTQQYDLQLDPG